jgi:hypothetical protein
MSQPFAQGRDGRACGDVCPRFIDRMGAAG